MMRSLLLLAALATPPAAATFGEFLAWCGPADRGGNATLCQGYLEAGLELLASPDPMSNGGIPACVPAGEDRGRIIAPMQDYARRHPVSRRLPTQTASGWRSRTASPAGDPLPLARARTVRRTGGRAGTGRRRPATKGPTERGEPALSTADPGRQDLTHTNAELGRMPQDVGRSREAAQFRRPEVIAAQVTARQPATAGPTTTGRASRLLAIAIVVALAAVADSMSQFGLLMMLTLLPLMVPSGNVTPFESMPIVIQKLMLAAPNTHFVMLTQSIPFRGAGLGTIGSQFLTLLAISLVLFNFALVRFRSFLTQPGLRAVPGLAGSSGRRAAVTGLSPGPDTPVRSKNDPTLETPPATAPESTLEVS